MGSSASKQGGFSHQRTGKDHPLLFAPGKFSGTVGSAGSKSDLIQPLQCDRGGLGMGQPPDQQRHHHVLQRGKLRQKIVNLPDEPDLQIAELDLRQEAMVFDWYEHLMSDSQRKDFAARIKKGIDDTAADNSVAAVRSRALGAIAIFDHVPQAPQRELERIVRQWWGGRMLPALKNGANAISRDDAYPLWELMHAIRDNTNIDLRETLPKYFKDFPIEHLMSHYPATFEGPDTQYRIGLSKNGEPDLRLAALSRAAELEMVALDTNAAESQVLQGWLMHNQYVLKGPFGAPYEFLWANPYQPGLSYNLVPLVYHNPDFGKLFIRSAWDEDALWFGLFEGTMQMFSDGHPSAVNPKLDTAPISLTSATVCFAQRTRKFELKLEPDELVFLIGLEAKRLYQVEVDDEEIYEARSDNGGILEVDLPHGKSVGFRLREAER